MLLKIKQKITRLWSRPRTLICLGMMLYAPSGFCLQFTDDIVKACDFLKDNLTIIGMSIVGLSLVIIVIMIGCNQKPWKWLGAVLICGLGLVGADNFSDTFFNFTKK